MSDANNDDDGEYAAVAAPTTKVRLYLRATNLPRSITKQQPDSQCQISVQHDDISNEETEIVYKSSNPRYTTSFPFEYEYGTQLLIFVDVNVSRISGFGAIGKNNSSEMKLHGRAVYDVQDILGTKYQTKARRLAKGVIMYAHIEQEFASHNNTTIPMSINESNGNNDSRILTLRLRAHSLIFTHSVLQNNRFAPSTKIIGKPDTYYELSRPAYSTIDDGTTSVHKSSASSSWIVLYRSPPVTESITPIWDEAMIDFNSLGSTTATSPILISIYRLKKKRCKEIGSFETTVQSLIESCRTEEAHDEEKHDEQESSTFLLQPKPSRGFQSNETTGEITVVCASIQRPDEVRQRSQRMLSYDYSSSDENDILQEISSSSSNGINNLCLMAAGVNGSSISSTSSFSRPQTTKFSDYVDAGLDIDLCVAIDFTSSNGDPRIPGTLHYSRDGMTNDYEDAIESIGSTVEKYSKNKEFPVWGFGAKFVGQVRHIFQCGQAPTATGIQGVLDAYRSVFEQDVIMSGPTEMMYVLKAVVARANKVYKDSSKHLKYSIILILTDGVVNDLQSTRDFVLKYRHLPLSVIVVGIGRADFTEMNQWNDEQADLRGRFTFVEFRALQFDPAALSRKALERVPNDVVDYFIGR